MQKYKSGLKEYFAARKTNDYWNCVTNVVKLISAFWMMKKKSFYYQNGLQLPPSATFWPGLQGVLSMNRTLAKQRVKWNMILKFNPQQDDQQLTDMFWLAFPVHFDNCKMWNTSPLPIHSAKLGCAVTHIDSINGTWWTSVLFFLDLSPFFPRWICVINLADLGNVIQCVKLVPVKPAALLYPLQNFKKY